MLDRLSDSFHADSLRAEALLREIARIIEEIHGVEGKANYHFDLAELNPGVHGEHTQAYEVIVSSSSPRRRLACIHEFGHALDGAFLNSVQFGGSPSDPPIEYASDYAERAEGTVLEGETLLCAWLASVRASNYCKALAGALSTPSTAPATSNQISKLLSVRELWARSYELFVCRRHPKSTLADEMRVECSDSIRIGQFTVHNYWQDDDFEDVEHEIEQIFRRLGWLIK
jgi:hypothetical protein